MLAQISLLQRIILVSHYFSAAAVMKYNNVIILLEPVLQFVPEFMSLHLMRNLSH